ncbi:DNA polymerase III subunit chi [Roseovarius sp. BRH_c41]|jgi:DNA polymerase-3 subunit chi|uniref:DNA polymerase III subunit chi n=1 Tax=Roseovarius sp. BRH_c41 TaxID=1629709 RepID=UPI0005F235C9|nr:DNA polymerase III subunit chi [Roseovarius sp. BRH_c41]KJS45691.1 MAG: DNA polymerase III subunit chi [Roseovarius sp. BRH_c41]
MGAAYFYHLTRQPLEATLPMLLEKSLSVGWRVVVRGRDRARMVWLDERLWLGPEDGFLPHGLSGGPQDADQPVLLTTDSARPNGAVCLMAIDAAEVSAQEVQMLDRVCILFDGNDDAAVQAARSQWKTLTGAGCTAQYWSEAGGRWEKKAEA